MKNHLQLLIIALLYILSGCTNNNYDEKDVIAKVGDAVLTKNDIKDIFAQNKMDNADSTYFVKTYVKNWIVSQILKQKAEKNLNDFDRARIEKLVQDYKTDLFVNKYKQLYIKQKLDTSVADTELVSYYHTFNFDYILKSPVIKGVEIKVPKKSLKYYDLLHKMKNADKNYDEIKSICNEFKFYFSDFDDKWVNFEIFKDNYKISDKDLKKGKLFVSPTPEDSMVYGMLYISDFLVPGDTIPYELVKNNLKKIILHKRKVSLFYQLINNTYQDALNDKKNYINKSYVIKEK
jgi:hypothetical protein